MARKLDHAPVGHTCPDIDKIVDMLNELRNANDELRTWGNEQWDRADEAEGIQSDLEKENDALKNTICDLESELDSWRSGERTA